MFKLLLIAVSLLPPLECHVVDGTVPDDAYAIQNQELRREAILSYTGIGIEISTIGDEYGVVAYLDGSYDPGVGLQWGQLEYEWRGTR